MTPTRPDIATNAKSQTRGRNALQLRCPWSISAAVRAAADQRLCSVSEYVRQAVIARMRADGINPTEFSPTVPPRTVESV
jgi:hypothetical protein